MGSPFAMSSLVLIVHSMIFSLLIKNTLNIEDARLGFSMNGSELVLGLIRFLEMLFHEAFNVSELLLIIRFFGIMEQSFCDLCVCGT